MTRGNPASQWLFIHPYVYMSVKKNRAVLYNTLNHLLMDFTPASAAWPILKRFKSESALYVAKISGKDLSGESGDFINSLRENYFGDIAPVSYSQKKPVQLIPILNLQKSMTPLVMAVPESRMLESEEIPDLLNGLTLYINEACRQSCSMCATARKQFLCCGKSTARQRALTLEDITALLQETRNSKLNKLNITGGNIFLHPDFPALVHLLNMEAAGVLKEYWCHYLNIADLLSVPAPLRHGANRLNMTIHFPVCDARLEKAMNIVEKSGLRERLNVQCVIASEEEADEAEITISKWEGAGFQMIPFFNGGNESFFRDHIYTHRQSLQESRLDMNEILERRVLNTHYFRKLIILSDKSIHASLNRPKSGVLGKDRLMQVIFNELHLGRSWRGVRQHVKPCKSCPFNALCPPISGYEPALGRYNLCHISR